MKLPCDLNTAQGTSCRSIIPVNKLKDQINQVNITDSFHQQVSWCPRRLEVPERVVLQQLLEIFVVRPVAALSPSD